MSETEPIWSVLTLDGEAVYFSVKKYADDYAAEHKGIVCQITLNLGRML